ncbi:MAG: hypothetical protein ACLPVF_07630, partial [Acidimicrobiales bacterium]
SYSALGQTIDYSYLITNTSGVTLSAVGITDTHPGLSGLSCPSSTLAVAASETCTATYSVTQADLTAGDIVDTATASGIPSGTTTPVPSSPSTVTVTAAD